MGAGISTLVITVVVLIFGEISPKSIAKESPEKFAMFSAPMINGLRIVLTPINWMFGQWKKLLSCLFKTSGSQGITSEELFTIVEEAQEEGSIDKEEGSLLRSALSFDDLEAGDILTPRIDMEGIPVESTQEEAQKYLQIPAIPDFRFMKKHWIISSAFCTIRIFIIGFTGRIPASGQ